MAEPDVSTNREWHFDQLKWALQALAIPAVDQGRLFPEWVVIGDEMALDFDHWRSLILANYGDELSQPQAERLAAIDRKLDSMSRDDAEVDTDLWCVEALGSSRHWVEVRLLAADALAAFGWPVQSPPVRPSERGTTFIR